MSHQQQISPRSEALNSILEVREQTDGAEIDIDTWTKIIDLAWDNRAQAGDRREIQRALRQLLLESTKAGQ